jgi:2-dehydro-3-deoxyphosphogluconate aldolase/(4S)-4-hydroxy-2-oxoglutarate aldolase
MARHPRLEVVQRMLESGLVPLFYVDASDTAGRVVEACSAAGVPCIEFTNRGDQAHLVFGELVARFASRPDLILGAGSILDPGTASLYLQLGAEFIVGPALNPEVARTCNRRKVAYLPGCATVGEISAAEELGVEICKIFPGGTVGGPEFVKAVRGPMPWTRLMPTGGIEPTRESVGAWIRAGAACLGMGSNLVTKESLAKGDYASIEDRCAQVLGFVAEARRA